MFAQIFRTVYLGSLQQCLFQSLTQRGIDICIQYQTYRIPRLVQPTFDKADSLTESIYKDYDSAFKTIRCLQTALTDLNTKELISIMSKQSKNF